MRLSMILAVARAERRSNRRLARYWVFAIIAVFFALLILAEFTIMHMFSSMSGTIGIMGPRYLVYSVGFNLLLVFLVGLVFLAFDVRARDERDRMVEALDSRPLSNAEFLVGKVAGLVFIAWMPMLIIAILFEGFGFTAMSLGWPFGDPVEPYSLIGFLFSTLTALVLWCSVVVLMAVVIRHRLIVAMVTLGLLGLQFWVTMSLPLYLQQWLSIMPSFGIASDILPRIVTAGDGARALAHWIMAAGLLCFAIALHPRKDSVATSRMLGMGTGLLALSIAALGTNYLLVRSGIEQQAEWLSAHEARSSDPKADMQSLSGSLVFDPGSHVSMDLEIDIVVPATGSLPTVLFTLNPGIEVTAVQLAGIDVPWTQADGLLELRPEQPLAAGTSAIVSLQASGSPDTSFGYLDTHINILESDMMQVQLGMLGFDTTIFESSYVAMMPGGHWLPTTGTAVPEGNPRTHPYDYYMLDLEVQAPASWTVAGPGKRHELERNDETVRYGFSPKSPLPYVGLIGAEFDQRSMTAAGIEFELLLYPGHDRNLGIFEDAKEAISERLTELVGSADALGLAYPYDALTLVETPNILRGYGGGWRMDSVQSMPGLMLMRESGFPTSRFEMAFRNLDAEPDSLGEAKLAVLETYFENDFSGGNVFTGGPLNVMRFQTSASGDSAHAINFLLDELTSLLLTGKRGFFSAHEFGASMGPLVGQTIMDIATGNMSSIADAVQGAAVNKPSVWDRALGAPLADMEPSTSPRSSLNVLTLKSEATARSILDGLGREETASLLAALVTEYRGRQFTAKDLRRVADGVDIDLEPIIGDWLHDASLPGFLWSSVTSVRLRDDDQGNPVYQTMLNIRNDETVPGLLRLRYQWGSPEPIWDATGPARIPAQSSVEIGLTTSTPLLELWSQPYLSLNRAQQRLTLPRVDSEQQVAGEPFTGTRTSDWHPPITEDIVVDDLDPGFTITRAEPAEEASFGGVGALGSTAIDMDQGLPEYQLLHGLVEYWARSVYSDSYGKYRRTYALVHPGTGSSHASFTTSLPYAGRWRLSYYLGVNANTDLRSARADKAAGLANAYAGLTSSLLGEYEMALVSDDDRQPIEFDGKQASFGWNDLGEFQLPEGQISLEVANVTTGTVVIVDAIRWRPARR